MPAALTRRHAPRRGRTVPARHVRDMLLEIAFRLHATRPVGRWPDPKAG